MLLRVGSKATLKVNQTKEQNFSDKKWVHETKFHTPLSGNIKET
jgi:hypothetical protein